MSDTVEEMVIRHYARELDREPDGADAVEGEMRSDVERWARRQTPGRRVAHEEAGMRRATRAAKLATLLVLGSTVLLAVMLVLLMGIVWALSTAGLPTPVAATGTLVIVMWAVAFVLAWVGDR